MKLVAFALAITTSIVLSAPAWAQSGSTDPAELAAEESQEEQEIAGWTQRLAEARARIDAAERRVAELQGAKERGASRRYPRGTVKGKYLEDLKAARIERDEAKRAYPELLEEARRAGVPNGILQRYEDPDLS